MLSLPFSIQLPLMVSRKYISISVLALFDSIFTVIGFDGLGNTGAPFWEAKNSTLPADEKLYSKLRVNGKLSKVLKNIELFNNIKEKKYTDNKIITRVSGVKVNQEQSIDSMTKLWGGLVDQVAFVDYNPWRMFMTVN